MQKQKTTLEELARMIAEGFHENRAEHAGIIQRLDTHDRRLDSVDTRLNRIDTRLDHVDSHIADLETSQRKLVTVLATKRVLTNDDVRAMSAV